MLLTDISKKVTLTNHHINSTNSPVSDDDAVDTEEDDDAEGEEIVTADVVGSFSVRDVTLRRVLGLWTIPVPLRCVTTTALGRTNPMVVWKKNKEK